MTFKQADDLCRDLMTLFTARCEVNKWNSSSDSDGRIHFSTSRFDVSTTGRKRSLMLELIVVNRPACVESIVMWTLVAISAHKIICVGTIFTQGLDRILL